jgi:hypothetical protein
MHALIVALLLFAASQANQAPSSRKPSFDKRLTQQEAQKKQKTPDPKLSVGECVNCFDVQAPHTDEKQKDPYDARTDSLYRKYLWFTIIGVCGGLIGLGLLYRQFKATETAANAAKNSADAATKSANHLAEQLGTMRDTAKANRDSADALVNAERAWLMVYLDWQPGSIHTLDNERTRATTAYLQCVCTNHGKTPAWIDEICCKFEIIPWFHESPDFKNMEPYDSAPEPVAAGASSGIRKLEPVADGMFIQEGKVRMVYGVVKYRDMFGLKRETTFGYQITPDQDLKRLAGRAYNENT